jgi:hypothetical protein
MRSQRHGQRSNRLPGLVASVHPMGAAPMSVDPRVPVYNPYDAAELETLRCPERRCDWAITVKAGTYALEHGVESDDMPAHVLLKRDKPLAGIPRGLRAIRGAGQLLTWAALDVAESWQIWRAHRACCRSGRHRPHPAAGEPPRCGHCGWRA